MILTRKMIDNIRVSKRMAITGELEDRLLQEFGTEPQPYEYSEQDLHEQVRKYIASFEKEPVL